MVEGAVDRLIAESRAEACAAGRKLALVHEIACAATFAEFAAVEVACALTLSRFTAENLVALASALSERLPTVLSALSNGDIDLPRARVFTEVLADLDIATAQSVADVVLPKAPSRTAGQLRDMLRRKALAADPAYAAARRARAALTRSVQVHSSDDGTASLVAFGLDAARTAAAMQRISRIAGERRIAGDPGRAEQLRADVFLELLEGKHEGTSRGVVNLTVNLDTLACFNDDPASLGGYGVIAADIARQWLETHPGYQWQYAIHDNGDGALLQQGLTRRPAANTTPAPPSPTNGNTAANSVPAVTRQRASKARDTGTARDAGTARDLGTAEARRQQARAEAASDWLARPPVQDPLDRSANAAMTRWIRLRDRTCRAPGCRMPAWQSDIDHNQRYADGGPTTHDNLCALCRHHHRVKETGGWVLTQTRPGHFTWISPMGRVYEIRPEPP